MEQNNLRKEMWNSAGKAAIILGLVSSAYLFMTQYLAQLQMPAVVNMLISFVLWAAKFAGCIWLMLFFMRKFVKENPQADNSSSFRFGIITSLLSALIYSAASFANTSFINKELFTEQMDMVMQNYARIMDSNTMNAMEKMLDMMPQITFFSTLAYCFLFGTVLSAILSRNVPSRDPFATSQPE